MRSTLRCARLRSADMLAVDTNVIVRYVVGDGGEQFTRAVEILEENNVSIALTVVLETEWVLRDAYELSREEVFYALEKLFGLPTVNVADPGAVQRAMTLAMSGMDFAEALHLAQSRECEAFLTFDKRLAKRASRGAGAVVRLA
jgi:predicted nucleic-acid-binding protein